VFDQEDLIFRTHELADWIEAVSITYGIASQSLITVGYSNGANIAASILLLRPQVLRRAVLLRSMLLLNPPQPPALSDTDVFIGAGEYDPLIRLADAERLADTLKGFGAQVTFQRQRADHRLIEADILAARDWIQQTNAFNTLSTG
jgi:phospholipase/carboxylesterase